MSSGQAALEPAMGRFDIATIPAQRTTEAPTQMRGYEPRPVYPPVGGALTLGWGAAVAGLPPGPLVLAVDGPEMVDWAVLVARLTAALVDAGRDVTACDAHDWLLPWPDIDALTASPLLDDDPDFATLSQAD